MEGMMSGWRTSSYSIGNGECVEVRSEWRKSSHSMGNGNCVEIRSEWRKSLYSGANGQCVEVGANWRKATPSSYNGNCVEVGEAQPCVLVRDTKQDGEGPVLHIPVSAWREFMMRVQAGV
jgi:hypothetical protein